MRVRRPGHPRRVQSLADGDRLLGRGRRTELHAHRVVDAAQELEVGAVEPASPVAQPEHVRRAVVVVAGQLVALGERLLVVEQQRLVAREQVDLLGGRVRGEVHAAGTEEVQGAVDRLSRLLVAAALVARRDELLVPGVHLPERGRNPPS